MGIIGGFTRKSMQKNRKRTLMTVLGVMLSTALMLAVAGMGLSLWKSIANQQKEENGSFHVRFSGTGEEADVVRAYGHVKKSARVQILGAAKSENPRLEDRPYLVVTGVEAGGEKLLSLSLAEGRMPENGSEIALTEEFVKKNMPEVRVGDVITLTLGQRMIDYSLIFPDEEPGEQIMYYGESYQDGETLLLQHEKTYTVTGILDHVSTFLMNEAGAGYPGITVLEEIDPEKEVDIYVVYDDPAIYRTHNRNLQYALRDAFGGEPDYYEPSVNQYVKYMGGASFSNNMMILGMVGIVIFIVIVTSIFVIRNSFTISVTEKETQLGMLRSVGATRRQMKSILYLEGLLVWAMGTLPGLALGTGVTLGLCRLVEGVLGEEMLGMHMIFYLNGWILLAVILLSLCSVYFACIGPARSLDRLSPIEAIRGNGEIRIRKKKIRGSRLIRRVFGMGGTIAEKNLKRSRRQYRSTVISLVVGITVFVSAAFFVQMGENMVAGEFQTMDIDIEVGLRNEYYHSPEERLKIMEDMAALPHADRAYIYELLFGRVDMSLYGTEKGKLMNEGTLQIHVLCLNERDMKEYLQKIEADTSDLDQAVILADCRGYEFQNGELTRYPLLNVEEGDSLSLQVFGFWDGEMTEKVEKTVRITAVTDTPPRGIHDEDGSIIVSQNNPDFQMDGKYTLNLYLTKNPRALQDEMELYAENARIDLEIVNYGLESRANQRFIFIVKFFLYGFVIVISLIGVTNIFNTITTCMEMRSREFAMLRSVGMTGREFNRMIRLESLFYGLRSLLFGLPLGCFLSWLIYRRMSGEYRTGFPFPTGPVLISILAVALIVGFTMHYSLGKIKKQNMIETIRRRNV